MYIPWKNDWSCPQCHECNRGKDKKCTSCDTPMPPDIWLNMKHPKEERKYCKKCGKRTTCANRPTEKKKSEEKE